MRNVNEVPYEDLTGTEKTALLLYLLSHEQATGLLQRFEVKQQKEIRRLISSFSPVGFTLAMKICSEFNSRVKDVVISESPQDFGRKLSENKSIANSMIEEGFATDNVRGLEELKAEEPAVIFNLVQDLHPQIIATILAYIGDDKGGKLLELFTPAARHELIYKVANMSSIKPSALKDLASFLDRQHTSEEGVSGYMPIGGTKTAASILNQLSGGMDEKALEHISESDAALAEEVRDNMFMFVDLLSFPDRDMQIFIAALDQALMISALKGQSQEIINKFKSAMSKRQAERFIEDLEEKGAMKISEVQEAQKEVLAIARAMGEKGEIVIPGKGEDYV